MRRINNPWILVALSIILLSAAWPPLPSFFFIFIAFVPLLLIEEHHYRVADKPLQYYLQVTLVYTCWNIAATYWTWFASPVGAIAAIGLNAQIQSIPWLLFHRTRKIFGDKLAYPVLAGMMLSIEYMHLNWDLAWPWLNIGNVFAMYPGIVQWYEITGVLGGSLWVYAVNMLVFFTWVGKSTWLRTGIALGLPILYSLYLGSKVTTNNAQPIETVVVQPNIDPYNEKFSGLTSQEQLERLISLSESQLSSQTQLLLWPETALVDYLDESSLDNEPAVVRILTWLEQYPNLMLITGASTVRFFEPGEKLSSTARKTKGNAEVYYDSYNTALYFKHNAPVGIYHKSKLVPGVEKMPYPKIFGFLESMAIDLGGTSGSLGRSDSAVVFGKDDLKVAPIICYESVFGEYVTEYRQQGAQLMAIITNDGWWKDTPGYRQHFHYGRLRAIENRKYVARSANTGISGFIDPSGKIMQQTSWWEEDVRKEVLYQNDEATFYSRSGDYLGKMAAFFSILVVLAGYVRKKTAKGY